MKNKDILLKIETLIDLLSLVLKLNRMEAAWILYADMFMLRINFPVYIEGNLKKAKEFIGYMEILGFKLNAVIKLQCSDPIRVLCKT